MSLPFFAKLLISDSKLTTQTSMGKLISHAHFANYIFTKTQQKTSQVTKKVSKTEIFSFPNFEMRRTFWKAFCWTFCLTGCAWQIYYISDQYFAYDSVTQVKITRTHNYYPPVLTFCFYLRDVLNNSGEFLNIADCFNRTPTIATIIDHALIHDEFNFILNEVNATTYEKFFKIEKLIKKNLICYSIRFHENIRFLLYYLVNGRTTPTIMKLWINGTSFRTSDLFQIYLTSTKDGARGMVGSFVAVDRKIFNSTTGEGDANLIQISYNSFTSIRLPFPYKTNCLDYRTINFESKKHCFEDCLLKNTISRLGKVPFSVVVNEPLDLQIISDADIKNSTFHKIRYSIEEECFSKCEKSNCKEFSYTPKLISTIQEKDLIVYLNVADSPDIISEYIPRLSFVEYAIYVLSCISFWVAFSPLQFLIENKVVNSVLGRKYISKNTEIHISNPQMIRETQNNTKRIQKLEKTTEILNMKLSRRPIRSLFTDNNGSTSN